MFLTMKGREQTIVVIQWLLVRGNNRDCLRERVPKSRTFVLAYNVFKNVEACLLEVLKALAICLRTVCGLR